MILTNETRLCTLRSIETPPAFGKPVKRSANIGKATNKTSVVGANAEEVFEIFRCAWAGPAACILDLLKVSRYPLVAHHMAEEKERISGDECSSLGFI